MEGSNFSIRPVREGEEHIVLEFIHRIARHERLEHEVVATVEGLHQTLFVDKRIEVVFAMEGETPVGFALFFYNYSTFVGRSGLYLEDLYVDQEMRGKGYGKKLFLYLTKLAEERGCGRMEWVALNWNTPAIDFYLALGAVAKDEWTTFRLTEERIKQLNIQYQ